MYYWDKKMNKTTLEDELLCSSDIRELYIGTAFISKHGADILEKIIDKYQLHKRHVHLYLSSEFSTDRPHELLKKLMDPAQVKIFIHYSFHAKVYYLKGKRSKAIYGSSNFTEGGFLRNIEFNNDEDLTAEKEEQIKKFFDFCERKSVAADDKMIQFFIDNQAEIEEIKRNNKNLQKKMRGFITAEDPIDEDDYDIENYYFDFQDYETFFPRNEARNDQDIRARRLVVQRKMLSIHKMIYPQIQRLGINCHWNEKNITSMTIPCEYNRGRVAWLGIRYGKLKKEIDVVNQNLDPREKDDMKGFQKHGCLQFCIIPKGFEINLFLAVKHDAIDRSHVQKHLGELKSSIEKEISKLTGYGMLWEIYNDMTGESYEFDIDKRNADEFCEYLKNDQDGCESYLKLFYSADDERIKTKESIAKEVVTIMEVLNPLYNAMVWRPFQGRNYMQ